MMPLLLVFPILVVSPTRLQAQDVSAKVERYQLDNGLRVLLRPVKGGRDACLVILYNIGGDHDPKGRSGLAHLVEHLYCTAAAGDVPARTFEQILKRYPRGQNFQTGDRYTICATVFDKGEVERELKEAAARMGDLKMTADDLQRELPRINDELRNMFGGIPVLAASNLAREKARPTPLGGRRGGLFEQIRATPLEEAQKHWRDYYRPGNAILVLAGAFDAEDARKTIQTAFGKLQPAKKSPSAAIPDKAHGGKAVELTVKPAFAKAEPAFCAVYRAPPPDSELYAPFLVAVGLLQQQRGKLIPDPKSYPIYFAALDDPEVISIKLPVGQGDTAAGLFEKVQKFVQILGEPGDVLDAGRQQVSLSYAWQLALQDLPDDFLAQDAYGLAFGLGRREQLGIDPGRLRKALAAVTGKDVNRVLSEVFANDKGAAVLVRPQQR
jgi:zinc protease